MPSTSSVPVSSLTHASTGTSMSTTLPTPTTLPSAASKSVSMSSTSSAPISPLTNASTETTVPTTVPTSNTLSVVSRLATNTAVSTTVPVVLTGNLSSTGVSRLSSHLAGLLAFNDLPQEEINRYLNIFAAQVLIPKTFSKILEWGCRKNPTDTFYNYLTKDKSLTGTKLKTKYRISDDEDLNKLKHADPSLMDGPLLCKVIKAACEDLKEIGDDVWKEENPGKIECLLVMLKERRNKVCHEIKTCAVSPQMFQDMIILSDKLIQAGGTLYNKSSDEIDHEIEQSREMIDRVTKTESERKLIALQYLFHTQGYSETKSYWEKYCSQNENPFPSYSPIPPDVFYPLDVLPKPSSNHDRPVSYEKMFDDIRVGDDRPVLILQGEAGSGKSTLLKQIGMQFFQLTNSRIPALEEFHLLHFLQCNNQTYNDLGDFIRKYFHETSKIVSPEDALRCFPYLGNLILIDGYDELNLYSTRVVKQLIEAKKKNPACQLVFTARPHVVSDLEDLLKREGVAYNIYQLMEISQEKQQLNFLERLDDNPCMRETFLKLPGDAKNFFVLPINLIQYYLLFADSQEKVQQWRNINDVVQDIMFQYETLITSKLKHRGIRNLDEFISEVLMGLCEFAFEALVKKMFTLDKDSCDKLRKHCYERIKVWGLMDAVDKNEILSVVYVTKEAPAKDAVPTYQYSHKSMQELMSARSLLGDLTSEQKQTLDDIILSRLQNMEGALTETTDISARLLNVYKFVLMIFSHPNKRSLLQRWLPQLETALTEAKADWQDVMMSCNKPENPDDDEVAKIAARKKLEVAKEWQASTARDITAIARMMPHAQPDALDVQLPASEGTPSDLATILQMFTGTLKLNIQHSYGTYTNCDHIVDELTSRCSVTALTGCLASNSTSVRSLSASLNQNGVRLDVSLENPSLHALMELQGKEPILNVKMRHHTFTALRPFPLGFSPPLLLVEDTPASGAQDLRATVLHYAPDGALYFSLWLENTQLDDAALRWLVKELHEAGVRTEYHRGKTCCTVARISSDGVCLHCQKTHLDAFHRCVWLQLAEEQAAVGGEDALTSKSEPLRGSALPAEDACARGDELEVRESCKRKTGPDTAERRRQHSSPLLEGEGTLSGHLNSYAIDVILTRVLQTITKWGCPKKQNETFWEYLEKLHSPKFMKYKKRFTTREEEMLKEVDCNMLDFNTLFTSIPDLCGDIAPLGTGKWFDYQHSLQGLLKRAKDIRNDGSYHPRKVTDSLRSEFEELAVQILAGAGERFTVEDTIVEAEVCTVRQQIDELWFDSRDDATENQLEQVGEEKGSKKKSFNDTMRLCGRLVVQEVASNVMGIVIEWGCPKPRDMTFLDYLSKLHDKRKMRRFSGSYQPLLRACDHSGFDVILLYKIIPFVCTDLDRSKILQSEKSGCSKVEGLLSSIITTRDDVMESYPGRPVPPYQLRLFEDLFTSLIIETGKRYVIGINAVKKEVTTARCKLFKVLEDCFMNSPRP